MNLFISKLWWFGTNYDNSCEKSAAAISNVDRKGLSFADRYPGYLEVDVVRNLWDVELLSAIVEVMKAMLDTAVSIVSAG